MERVLIGLLLGIAIAAPVQTRSENDAGPSVQTLLAPIATFAHALNTRSAAFPASAFADSCAILDTFGGFSWSGRGAARHWYASLVGGSSPARRARFLASRKLLTYGAPQLVHPDREGDDAYIVLPATLTFDRAGKRVVQRARWLITEHETPSGWRISGSAWVVAEGNAVGGK